MNILVSNHSLKRTGGTETFTYTLIEELIRQGHKVEYFCFEKGTFSERIEKDFKVSFKTKNKYDLILANHYTTVNELYKYGLTIQTCHGIFPQLEQPSKKAHGYVAISQEVQNHLFVKGYSSKIIYNGIDCNRFRPHTQLRKDKPKVLSLCHSAEAHSLVKEACDDLGLEFNILDKYTDDKWNVEEIINKNDLIVGLGRSAYEAFACGRPVVIFDKRGYSNAVGDGYFLDVITESIKNNCSGRAINKLMTSIDIAEELLKYRKEHGELARSFALNSFNISKTVEEYLLFTKTISRIIEQNTVGKRVRRIAAKLTKFISPNIKSIIKQLIGFK